MTRFAIIGLLTVANLIVSAIAVTGLILHFGSGLADKE